LDESAALLEAALRERYCVGDVAGERTAWAMSPENVEIARQLLKRWNRGDHSFGRELYDDSCEIVFSASWFPDPGAYRVGAEALGAWTTFTEAFEQVESGVDRIVEAGEQVVALTRVRGRGRASGAAVAAETAIVFTFRGGKVARVELTDRAEAFEAAGLRE
jgi:ketosteroid isomerase-like protein